MSVPDYQSIMLPLLEELRDGHEHHIREVTERLAHKFHLTNDELKQKIPSGKQSLFDNRVGWARTYLKSAGCLEMPKRGTWVITQRGLNLLSEQPTAISKQSLMRFAEFGSWLNGSNHTVDHTKVLTNNVDESTPDDLVAQGYKSIRRQLAQELLDRIKSCPPQFFEQLVVDLLVRMGYGGSQADAGSAIGRSGDGGVDGIIKEDKLGLDTIYLQAKRWEGNVGRPEIQRFAGALQGLRAKKGVFITTSSFTAEAVDYARLVDTRIVLISGEELTDLMVDYNLGVSTYETYELKKIDLDYFSEE